MYITDKQNKGLFVFDTLFTIIWITLSGSPDTGPVKESIENALYSMYVYLLMFTKSLRLHVKHFIALTKRESVKRFFFFVITDQATLSTHRPVTTKNTGKYDSIGDKKEKKHVYA